MVAYSASAVLILSILKLQVWHPIRYPTPQNAAFLTSLYPDFPIVLGDGKVFFEMNHHESAALVSRLYFLKDRKAALQYAKTNFFQDFEAPDTMKDAGFPLGATTAPYADLVSRQRQFLLLGTPTEWVFCTLRSSGASVALIGDFAGRMPYPDTSMYLVTMPSR